MPNICGLNRLKPVSWVFKNFSFKLWLLVPMILNGRSSPDLTPELSLVLSQQFMVDDSQQWRTSTCELTLHWRFGKGLMDDWRKVWSVPDGSSSRCDNHLWCASSKSLRRSWFLTSNWFTVSLLCIPTKKHVLARGSEELLPPPPVTPPGRLGFMQGIFYADPHMTLALFQRKLWAPWTFFELKRILVERR